MRLQRALNISFTVLVFLGLAAVGLFVFSSSYLRFWETIIDFGVSVKYYFCTLFEIENPTQATIVDYSKIIVWDTVLPEDFEAFKSGATEFFRLLVDKDNFLSWLTEFGVKVGDFTKILCIILPCLLVLLLVIKRLYSSTNSKHNIDTVPLRIFKGVSSVTYQPVKQFMAQYICFVREHDWIWKLWVAILVFHFNLASVILAFFAFYFYFAVSFDFGNIYVQMEKTGEKIVYSKGLPQFFISDIMDEDIVCRIGQEDRKLLLYDDFNCWDEGYLMGKVSKDVIAQMRKAN